VARIEAQLPVEQLGDIASAHPCWGLIHVRSTICSPSSDLPADTVVVFEPLSPLGLVVEAELGSERGGVTVLELSHADAAMITATIKNTRLVTDFIVPGWPARSRAGTPASGRPYAHEGAVSRHRISSPRRALRCPRRASSPQPGDVNRFVQCSRKAPRDNAAW